MDDVYKVLFFVLLLAFVLLVIQFGGIRRFPNAGNEFSHNFGQGLYGTLAAIAILIAGILYLVERQWSPRFSVDLSTRTALLPAVKGEPHAVIQALVAVTNQGRTSQTVEGLEVGADSLRNVGRLGTNQHGDLPGRNIFSFSNPKTNTIAPGETDLIAIEVPVACSEQLVRLVIKVPLPHHRQREPGKAGPVYERKALVSLDGVCKDSAAPSETPFQGANLPPAG